MSPAVGTSKTAMHNLTQQMQAGCLLSKQQPGALVSLLTSL